MNRVLCMHNAKFIKTISVQYAHNVYLSLNNGSQNYFSSEFEHLNAYIEKKKMKIWPRFDSFLSGIFFSVQEST